MLDFEAGKAYDVKLEYFENIRDAEVRLNWRQPGAKDPYEEALEAARAADVVIFAGGLNGEVEGEEMPVIYPGFAGGDRTEIALPKTQQKLLEDLHKTGKPVVLVLMTGSALAVEWAKANLPAVLVAWYPGQQGGNAIADVLFGKVNPSGRLPVTFYKSVGDLPPFADYSMKNRTYKYFTGEPLYAFGHGLSYTRFDYTGMRIAPAAGAAADAFDVSFDVQNTGTRAGHEVPQLYARALDAGASDAAARAARLHAHPPGAGRPAARILPRHEAGPGVLRRSGEALRHRAGRVRDGGRPLQRRPPRDRPRARPVLRAPDAPPDVSRCFSRWSAPRARQNSAGFATCHD